MSNREVLCVPNDKRKKGKSTKAIQLKDGNVTHIKPAKQNLKAEIKKGSSKGSTGISLSMEMPQD